MRRARKVGGSYQAEGTVVAEFLTTTGEQRYVFEFDVPQGMLHIFGQSQLKFEEPVPKTHIPEEQTVLSFRPLGQRFWMGGYYKGSSFFDKLGVQAWAPNEVAEWRYL